MKIHKSVGSKSQNSSQDVKIIQSLLNRKRRLGDQLLRVDGICGVKTIAAILQFQADAFPDRTRDGIIEPNGPTFRALTASPIHSPAGKLSPPPQLEHGEALQSAKDRQIAWGARVPSLFKKKVVQISKELGVSPDLLMAAMAFESGETFSPSIKNAAGSGAVGLIQFMPSTAKALGTDIDKLSRMSAEDQLDYVKKYFQKQNKKLETIEDIYMAILYPAAVGKGSDHVLFKKETKVYDQNKGLDKNKDGQITVGEAAAKVRNKLTKGLRPGYIG